ncbi:MAG: hypothetical protein QOH51_751 [Acidobacteriota bacterium]|jgi:hypothetical protein|nr:hypothetical protein [Acidobacteriota bacterium]
MMTTIGHYQQQSNSYNASDGYISKADSILLPEAKGVSTFNWFKSLGAVIILSSLSGIALAHAQLIRDAAC